MPIVSERTQGYPLGLAGATSATRYVGGNASGAPLSGTFAVGDFVVNGNGSVFVCTVAGSPGTWVDAATIGPSVSSVFSRTGAVVAAAGDYTGVAVGGTADALATGALTNAMVNAAAAIAYAKLSLTGSVVDADVAAAAAVAVSKLAAGLAGQGLPGVTPSYAYPPGFEIADNRSTP